MARILYAASGDGFGHAVRLHSVGGGLLEHGHDVRFVSCGKTWDYLHAIFPDRTHESFGLFTIYNQGKVEAFKTVLHNARRAWHSLRPAWRSLGALFDAFKPQLVITDFEPFSAQLARLRGVPYISVDNQHLLTHCAVQHPSGCARELINAYLTIRLYYGGAKRYLISTFCQVPIRHQPAKLIPPILRSKVYTTEPRDEGFILAYKGAGGENDAMRRALEQYDRFPIRAYGFGLEGARGHIMFKATSPEGFLSDLASCRAVIATAGHSLVCEAIYFEKPMLLLPVHGQYEQIVNAHHVRHMGIGDSCNRLDAPVIEQFTDGLAGFRAALAACPKASLDAVLSAIEKEIP